MLDLERTIEPGSLRGIGGRSRGVEPHQLPIGCRAIEDILETCSGQAFTLGRVQARNAFVWVMNGCPFLYVRPGYASYRRLAHKRFPAIPAGHDVDHVLARALARELNLGYVLVAVVPSQANRAHGWVEKLGIRPEALDTRVCFPDERIFHKVLRRRPTARQSEAELKKGYDPASGFLQLGLTVRQAGLWNLSMGFDQDPAPDFTKRLKPYLPCERAQPAGAGERSAAADAGSQWNVSADDRTPPDRGRWSRRPE